MTEPINKTKLSAQAGAVILLILGLLAWLVHAETKPLERDELKIEVGHLRSFSAEAGLLAEQRLSARVTETFFQTQTYLLRDKIESSRSSLEAARIESGIEVKHWQARQLAGQLKSAVESMGGSFANPDAMNFASRNLKALSTHLKELEESLKE